MQKMKFDKQIDLLSIDDRFSKLNLIGVLDSNACIKLKNRFNFLELSEVFLSFSFEKISENCWELAGNLKAKITQSCVVTSKPVKEKLDIKLEERYVLQNNNVSKITDIDINGPEVEVLETSMLNVGELVAQIIGVEAESFPKLENTPENHFFGSEETKQNMFAKLAVLKK